MLDDDLVVSEISAEEIDVAVVVRERTGWSRWIAAAIAVVALAIGVNLLFGGNADPAGDDAGSGTTTTAPVPANGAPPEVRDVSLSRVVGASTIWSDEIGWTSLGLFGWRDLLEASCDDFEADADSTAERVVDRFHLDRGVPIETARALMGAALAEGCGDADAEADLLMPNATRALLDELERSELVEISAVSASQFVLPDGFEVGAGLVLSLRRNGTTSVTTDPVALAVADGGSLDPDLLVPNEQSLPVITVEDGASGRTLRIPQDVNLEPPFAVQVCSLRRGGACGVARYGFDDPAEATGDPLVVDTLSAFWIDEVGWTARSWREWGAVAVAGCEDEANADAIRELVAADPTLAIGTSTELAVHLIWQMAKANCRNRHPGQDVFKGNRPVPWQWFGSFEPGGAILRDNNGGGGGITLFHRPWGTQRHDPMSPVAELTSPEVNPSVRLPDEMAPGHYRMCPLSAADVTCPARLVLPDGTLAFPFSSDGRVAVVTGVPNTPIRGLDPSTGQTEWSRPLGSEVSLVGYLSSDDPALDEMLVIGLVRQDGSVFVTALELSTGEVVWSTLVDDSLGNGMRLSLDGADLVVEVGDYTPGPAETIRRLDPATGIILEDGPIED